jgi:hypothetical protein
MILAALLALAACSSQGAGGAAGAIEAYIRALVEKDADRLSTLSCAAWEADAQLELESFGAVTAELEGPECEESGEEADMTLVSCQGKITANYGAEVLELNLGDQTYQAAFENGEWRMCGYR